MEVNAMVVVVTVCLISFDEIFSLALSFSRPSLSFLRDYDDDERRESERQRERMVV
jgi:hypothetical protein